MPPGQKERRAGKLLAEARNELYQQAAIIAGLRYELSEARNELYDQTKKPLIRK